MRQFWKTFRKVNPFLLLLYAAWIVWSFIKKGGPGSEVVLWLWVFGLAVMLVDVFLRRDQLWPKKRPKGDLRDA